MNSAGAIDLRLKRAEEHLVELQRLGADYALSKPYTVSHRVEGKAKEHVYRLRFTSEPDERIAVVAGDFLHNVRSALNYLMTGMAPSNQRDKAQFPIFVDDPFARDPITRRYVQRRPEQRKRWQRYVRGVDPRAVAYIESLQPYQRGKRLGQIDLLLAMNLLSNADKHHSLVITAAGLEDARVMLWKSEQAVDTESFHGALKDGAEVSRSQMPVKVNLDGTAVVLVGVGGRDRGEIRIEGMDDLLLYVRGVVVQSLAGYLRR